MFRYRILLLFVSLGIASAALASGGAPVFSVQTGAIVSLALIVGVLALGHRTPAPPALNGSSVDIAIQNPPKEPLRISWWSRETYIAVLNRFATLMGGIRALTYIPTILTLMASANSSQHSLWTWISWILANGTMTMLLYERNDRKADSVILIQLANTVMCVVTTAVILWYRF